MTPFRALCCLLTLFVAGCSAESAPDRSESPAEGDESPGTTASRPRTNLPEWDPSLFEGGGMFRDYAAFRAYVSRAEFIAVGTLTQWDGTGGAVEVKTVLHGKAPHETVRVLPTGGRVLSAPGQQVLFLLSRRDGELKLHSFCGASGLYAYSESLVTLIKDALGAVPTLAIAESEGKQPGGELVEYGRPFSVVMIPRDASAEVPIGLIANYKSVR